MTDPTWKSPADFHPEVVLRLRETVPPPQLDRPIDDQLVQSGIDVPKLRARFGGLVTRPAFVPTRFEHVNEPPLPLDDRARRLLSFRLPPQATAEAARGLAEQLRVESALAVERAYVVPRPAPPPSDPEGNPSFARQTYLDGNGNGINVMPVWDYRSGTAAGTIGDRVTIADIEEGWDTDPDLPAFAIDGDNYQEKKHGLQVMGVLLSQNNTEDCIGIAHGAKGLAVSLHQPDATGAYEYTRHGAIERAAAQLAAGDVMLLEVQVYTDNWELMPAEYDELVYFAIERAVRKGIVVVEAAANEGVSLDGMSDADGTRVFDRKVRDSGAILVAGGLQTAGAWGRLQLGAAISTNWGSRVDCFAPASSIVTLPTEVPATFGMTSAASAIVAGAAALVQSWAIANGSGPFTPAQVRELLADPETGTAVEGLGVMPDLERVIQMAMTIV